MLNIKLLILILIINYLYILHYLNFCNKFIISIIDNKCRCLNYYNKNQYEYSINLSKKCAKFNYLIINLYIYIPLNYLANILDKLLEIIKEKIILLF